MLDKRNRVPQLMPKHGLMARGLHWMTALVLVYGYVRNGDVTNALLDPVAMTREVWFALALGVLFAVRFIWMEFFNGGASRLPQSAPRWEHVMSRFVHYGIYVGVASIIVSGLLIAWMASSAPVLFGTSLAFLVGPTALGAVIEVHEATTVVTAALIAIHIAGALWHKVILGDNVWQSMVLKLPRIRRPLMHKLST